MSADERGTDQQRAFHVTATVQMSDGPIGQPDAQQHRTNADAEHERRILRTQVIIAGAAIVALVATAWQMHLTRKTFQTAQRAWVLVDEAPMRPADKPDAPGSFLSDNLGNLMLRFKNFGAGPAKDVTIATRFACLPAIERCPDVGGHDEARKFGLTS